MSLSQVIYGSCSAAFVILIILMLLRGRISGVGLAVSCACALTSLWAANGAFPGWLPLAANSLLDSLRLSAWLIFMVALVSIRGDQRRGSVSLPLLFTAALCAVVLGYEGRMLFVAEPVSITSQRTHDVLRIGLGIAGLLAAENLLRNVGDAQRRNLWPLCLALGGMFAFELFLYAEQLLTPRLAPTLSEGRGLIGLLAVPPLALAMARNRDWRIDIHVSRTVVFHTAVLIASGVFFLVLATVGTLVKEIGGSWGPSLQLLTLVGSAAVLMSIFGSRAFRFQLKYLISRHFYSHRFDYRTEWLRFVDTVSQSGTTEDALRVRVIRALAQIVDSPAGTLWRLEEGRAFIPDAGWSMTVELGQRVSTHDPFIAAFREGSWIQQRAASSDDDWPFDFPQAWLAIPLAHRNVLVAFVVLAAPPRTYALDWETFDLLRAAGKQTASYLAEERSAQELLDSRSLNEYSKRFAFVIHDLKNLAHQLDMVVSNARFHLDNPEFQKDMLLSVEDAVARMNRLLAQLHAQGVVMSSTSIEVDSMIADLVNELSTAGAVVETKLRAPTRKVAVDRDRLRSILLHLLNNACEAAQPGSAVVVSSRSTSNEIIIDIKDDGPGMDANFIRNDLFRPFRSTKTGGFGIGAYQTRELLRMSGGDLDIISKVGVGTTMRVTLPAQDRSELVTPIA